MGAGKKGVSGLNPAYTGKQIYDKVMKYIEETKELNKHEMVKPATVAGFCLYMKIDKPNLYKYFNCELAKITEEDKEYLRTAHGYLKTYLEDQLECNGLTGKVNPTIAIFSLKNNHGWTDRLDQNINANVNTIKVEPPKFED